MHEITCYHASGFVQNGSFPWIRTTISGSRDRRNAFIRGRNTMPCERMLPYVHMARNSFYPHLMVDEWWWFHSPNGDRTHVVPRPGLEPGASCSVDKCAIQLRYQGNAHMMVPMRLTFRRPSRIQPARDGFRILPGESECPVLHRMEQHDEYNECISDLHSLIHHGSSCESGDELI